MQTALFDLDKTIIAKSAMLAFGRPLYAAGFLNRRMILRAMYGQFVFMLMGADEKKMDKLRTAMLALIRGWDQQRIADIVRETLDEVISPIIYAEALELIRAHQAAGRKVVIISSSPAEVVEPLAEYVGVHDFIATRARVDAQGRYSGELDFYAYGPHKAAAIRDLADREDIDLEGSFAYSDSITDLPLLETVGHPVAVNPDRDLARVARERDWEIKHFTRPVRLREDRHTGRPSLVIGAVALGAVAGSVVVWWLMKERQERRAGHRSPASSRIERISRRARESHGAQAAAANLYDAVRYSARAAAAVRRAARSVKE